MSQLQAEEVLERFVEADLLLRQAREQLTSLTSARVSAEHSAARLAEAASAIANYADVAKEATQATVEAHAQVAASLRTAHELNRSFDSSAVLDSIAELQAQVGTLSARLEAGTAALTGAIEKTGTRLVRHVTVQATAVTRVVEASTSHTAEELIALRTAEEQHFAELSAQTSALVEEVDTTWAAHLAEVVEGQRHQRRELQEVLTRTASVGHALISTRADLQVQLRDTKELQELAAVRTEELADVAVATSDAVRGELLPHVVAGRQLQQRTLDEVTRLGQQVDQRLVRGEEALTNVVEALPRRSRRRLEG